MPTNNSNTTNNENRNTSKSNHCSHRSANYCGPGLLFNQSNRILKMKTFQINPADGRKSFYGKCIALQSNTGITKLISYETEVAIYDQNKNEIKIFGWYSATTARHINAFLDFFGVPPITKKQMETKPTFQVNN